MSNENGNTSDKRMVTQVRESQPILRPIRPAPVVSGVALGFEVRDRETFEAFGATITLERTGAGRVTCIVGEERIDALALNDKLFELARKQREAAPVVEASGQQTKPLPLAKASARLRG